MGDEVILQQKSKTRYNVKASECENEIELGDVFLLRNSEPSTFKWRYIPLEGVIHEPNDLRAIADFVIRLNDGGDMI